MLLCHFGIPGVDPSTVGTVAWTGTVPCTNRLAFNLIIAGARHRGPCTSITIVTHLCIKRYLTSHASPPPSLSLSLSLPCAVESYTEHVLTTIYTTTITVMVAPSQQVPSLTVAALSIAGAHATQWWSQRKGAVALSESEDDASESGTSVLASLSLSLPHPPICRSRATRARSSSKRPTRHTSLTLTAHCSLLTAHSAVCLSPALRPRLEQVLQRTGNRGQCGSRRPRRWR